MKKVEELSQNIASHSKKVVSLTKKGVYEGLINDLETVLKHEALAQSDCIRSEEAYKGIKLFLKERAKRKEKK